MRLRWLAPLVAGAFAAHAAQAAEQLVDGIAAQVGGDIVLVSEVMRAALPVEQQMRSAGAPESELAKARANALETLIEARLLAKVVKQADLHVTDAEIDETIAGIAEENGISVEQLEASVTSHDISYKEYREQIKSELERRKVIQSMIASKVRVEESDLKRVYAEQFANQPTGGETVHVRQILVVASEESGRDLTEACRIANDAAARIQKGAAFEEVAKEVSAVAPAHGGDIGWVHADSMAPWMTEAFKNLQPGGVTNVIELPFGCTLMKLVERQDWKPVSYDGAKKVLEQQAFEAKVADEYRRWMNQLRDNTYIERRGYFADAAKLGAQKLPGEIETEERAGETGRP
jgi:peptidyl-prolyl cis-trans isomerase SurA